MCTVADPLWCLPVSADLVDYATTFDLVVTLEDNLVVGGAGQQLRAALDERDSGVRILILPNPHLETPHYEVTRLRDDQVAEGDEDVLFPVHLCKAGKAQPCRLGIARLAAEDGL